MEIGKRWLGCAGVAKMLQVSPSTVKNLWRSGRLPYKCSDNKQKTRKSSVAMILNFQTKFMY